MRKQTVSVSDSAARTVLVHSVCVSSVINVSNHNFASSVRNKDSHIQTLVSSYSSECVFSHVSSAAPGMVLNPCPCFTSEEVSHVEVINVHGSVIECAEYYFGNFSDTDNR